MKNNNDRYSDGMIDCAQDLIDTFIHLQLISKNLKTYEEKFECLLSWRTRATEYFKGIDDGHHAVYLEKISKTESGAYTENLFNGITNYE